MAINAWKTTFVGINKPAKVVSGTADSFSPAALWPYANGVADPYYAGGVNPQPYRWTVTFSVAESFHGSHLTRTPFRFNANDIEVGDFVAGADDGKVCEIISITAKDDFTLTAVVEDRLRYNTFRSATGDGLFTCPGNVIFFQINELGYPMIDPVPSTASASFADNVLSRFQYMNPLTNYVLEKPNHGFEQGDAICIEGGEFVLSDANNVDKFIGTVVYPGPGPDQFILRPANGIIDFAPNLPGTVGDYIYPSIDGSGDLVTGDQSRRPIFLKIANAIPTYTIGNNINTVGIAGDVVNINGTEIAIGVATLDQAITAINTETAEHHITASKVNAPVTLTTVSGNLALGTVAGIVPFSATINGVSVNFTTTSSGAIAFGDPSYADCNDMATDINAAAITNVTASVDSGNLVLTHAEGGSITIVNTSPTPFAGANSASGLPLSAAANTTTFVLKLEDADGGPMTLRDISGIFFYNAGVISGQNGRYAIGLNIEQGLRSSATTVVANIAARDALNALIGDQVYVISDDNGEWAMYVYNGAVWNRIQNQRSEATDARTIESEITLPQTGSSTIGTVTSGRRILNVAVSVDDALDGINEFTVEVGGTPVWEYSKHGGPGIGIYSIETDLFTDTRQDVVVDFPANSASGAIRVEVTYL